MNRNEAIEFLKRNVWGTAVEGWNFDITQKWYCHGIEPVIRECHLLVRTDSLQFRIETLLDMKFETEEKLLETIGSLWGSDLGNEVYELIAPLRNESDKGPLDTLKRLVLERNDLEPYRKEYHEIKDIICKAGVLQLGELVTDSIRRLVESQKPIQAKNDFETRVTHLLLNTGFMGEGENTFEAIHKMIAREQTLSKLHESQQKTYWDGVEPLRVGHIVAGGEVVNMTVPEYCVRTRDEQEFWRMQSEIKPHPFAKYTEQELEFLQAQVEAGVIKLC